MDYIRLDPLIGSRPRTMGVGWWCRQVYLQLLIVSGKYDLRGRVGPQYANEEWFAAEWGCSDFEVPSGFSSARAAINAAFAKLTANELLVRDGDTYVISGWEEFYGKRDYSTPRVQAFRAKQVGTKSASSETAETPETLPTNPPTEPTSTSALSLLVGTWNDICGEKLPRVTKLAGKRKVLAEARLKEYGYGRLVEAMQKVVLIPGLLGKAGGDGWRADFDWFIQPLSVEKILSGKYDQWGTRQGKPVQVLEDPHALYKEE